MPDEDIGEAIEAIAEVYGSSASDEDIREAIADEDIDMEVESESDMGGISDDGGLDPRDQAQLQAEQRDTEHRTVNGFFN